MVVDQETMLNAKVFSVKVTMETIRSGVYSTVISWKFMLNVGSVAA